MKARVWIIVAAALAACRREEVRPEELFQAQSQGLSYLETSQLPEAAAQFQKVIALAPNEPLGYANLGLTYLQAARYKDAEDELRRARKLDPTNPDIGLIAAKLYAVTGRDAEARTTLEQLRRDAPRNAHVLYALAELDAQHPPSDTIAGRRYENELREVLALSPANLAVRLALAGAMARREPLTAAVADSAVQLLEAVRGFRPEIPADTKPLLAQSIDALRSGNATAARSAVERFIAAMQLTHPYQASLNEVKWTEGPLPGRPVLEFTPKSIATLRANLHGKAGSPAELVRFVDATSDAGLPEPAAAATAPAGADSVAPLAIAVGDYDGDGTDDLFASLWSPEHHGYAAHLYHVQRGQFLDVTVRAGISIPGGAIFATFADVDNDGHLDLFVIGADRRPHLLHNDGAGRFQDVTAKSGITNLGGARKALFVDIDHDGDLDLVLVGGGGPTPIVYRNNLDGTFTDVTQAVGLAALPPAAGPTRDAAFADFDGDGRVDLFVTRERGNASLYRNIGNRQFSDAGAASGIAMDGGSAIAVGDYDNRGTFDIFVAGTDGHAPTLWLNDGTGSFKRDVRSDRALAELSAIDASAALFVDYDNDGWLDLVVVGTPRKPNEHGRGIFLFHNDGTGRFADRSTILPPEGRSALGVAASDVDGDGDQDLLVATAGGVRLLRNDGGNASLSMQVQLLGLRSGSGKNNDFGIGAKVEVRAADLRETRVVTSRVTSFGLGPHLKADVVRIEWPNGVPQTIYFPGTDQDVLEKEVLKGSCAFLYAWNGTRFEFVTDVMWRSALGMPLGMLGGGATAFAPAGASQEYLRIPGSALQPRGGKYVVQVTEELWETAYADRLELLAVDHPDSIDVFVDERFVPPGPPVRLRIFDITHPQPPRTASDDRGRDLLAALRTHDFVYASDLTPLRYQGLVEPHDLILDLGPDAGRDSSFLFLRGWIYPTDASINVALSQQSQIKPRMPTLEVRDATGRWVTAIANLGFPSGKDKTMVIGLSGKFPTSDHHVRIRTNLQIYWDQAFVAQDIGGRSGVTRITPLEALSADLHFRGYSRTYRKGGRYGPWWFDYDSVSTAAEWRPIEGSFTRFGDVLPLLKSADDMYVIMAPGDEMTVEFDATAAPALPAGWRRDFLLYSDGWIKDSDLNTAFGSTVGPLPFHAIREYPYAPGDSYPADSAHQRYLRQYNTRRITRGRSAGM